VHGRARGRNSRSASLFVLPVRRALLAVSVVLVALAWVVAPAFSRGSWAPQAEDWEAAVPLPAGAAAARVGDAAPRLLPPVRAPGRFDLVGFRWRSPDAVKIDVRVRRDGGAWTRWAPAAGAADHGAPRASDPVWAGGADVYQLRVTRAVRGLRAHFVNVTGTRTGADRLETRMRGAARSAFVALLPGVAHAQAAPGPHDGRPAIVPRSGWDPNHQCDPTHAPVYGRVDMAFVHHTVNLNAYGPEDSAGIVLAICRYHEQSNGWWDVGYNFLVDRYGRIFEGRAGGVSQPVVGAQAQGWNSVSTGVSSIGTFERVGQTSAGLRALGQVIGWKLALHGAPRRGTIVERSGGGSLNRYVAGKRVRFARISGHRDGDATACPGSALYAQLPEIRRLAAAAAGPVVPVARLSLTATPAAVTARRSVTLSGRLALPTGTSPAGSPGSVAIERQVGRRWIGAGAAALDENLGWSLRLRVGAPGRYRARAGKVVSPSVTVRVRPVLTLHARRVRRTGILGGTVRPTVRRVILDSRLRTTGQFLRRRSLRVRDGRFGVRVTLVRGTSYAFLAHTPATGDLTGARSHGVTLRG